MTHGKRQVRRSLGTRLFVLMAAMVMLLAGCVMPDGTVYTIPPEVRPADVAAGASIIEAEQDAPSADEPSPADPYIAAGREYGEAGDLEAALAEFDQAIAADSNAALAYYFRAMTYARLGDFGAAMADIERAITRDAHKQAGRVGPRRAGPRHYRHTGRGDVGTDSATGA